MTGEEILAEIGRICSKKAAANKLPMLASKIEIRRVFGGNTAKLDSILAELKQDGAIVVGRTINDEYFIPADMVQDIDEDNNEQINESENEQH